MPAVARKPVAREIVGSHQALLVQCMTANADFIFNSIVDFPYNSFEVLHEVQLHALFAWTVCLDIGKKHAYDVYSHLQNKKLKYTEREIQTCSWIVKAIL